VKHFIISPAAASQHEASVVGMLLETNGEKLPPNLARLLQHAPESFDDERHGQIAAAIRTLKQAGKPVHAAAVAEAVKFEGATIYVSQLANSALPPDIAELEAGPLWEAYCVRRMATLFGEAHSELKSNPAKAGSIAGHVRAALDSLRGDAAQTGSENLSLLLEKRRFNHAIAPPAVRPIYTLNGGIVSTPGNLTSITSAIKTGKSAVITAMAGATMPHNESADLLGFGSTNPEKFAVLHFDSEQSPDDHWILIDRALRRAGLREPPPWFYSYCLTGLGWKRGWACVTHAMQAAAETHGGIHSSLIDGVADLVADVNDPEESNDFVATLQDMAIGYSCAIAGVIHFNPGGEKTRGHLGSQLERKAETNLRLDKENGVTTIWSDKQRRAPIPKDTGPCFQWSDEAGMHISVATRQSAADAEEVQRLTMLAEDLFSERQAMRYTELVVTAKKRLAVSDRTAARRISELSRLGVIKKIGAGLWTKAS